LEKRLSKHKITIFFENLERHGPFGPPLATPMSSDAKDILSDSSHEHPDMDGDVNNAVSVTFSVQHQRVTELSHNFHAVKMKFFLFVRAVRGFSDVTVFNSNFIHV